MECKIPRIVIAGTNSGVGKTTIVTGLLGAIVERGLAVQSYKIGPDYIDPGYHRLASQKASHNLDTWLVPADQIAAVFAKTAVGNDIAVIEGVMGLYDGGKGGVSSTAEVAKLLQAPVVLVIDAKSMGESAAAIALGYKLYDSGVNLVGVIINRLGSDSHRDLVCTALEKIGIAVLGCLRRDDKLHMPERHLGLTPVTENDGASAVASMVRYISQYVDVDKIIELAKNTPPLLYQRFDRAENVQQRVRIGIAKDEVFSFYYPESLEVLANNGVELIDFSPLYDQELPPEIDGLVLGGGFPEMFVEQLQANADMRQAIYQAAKNGMPIYAECGGFMYLTRQIVDFSGATFDMVGIIPAICVMQDKLQTVGYVEATATSDNVLAMAGQVLRGHEFHFSKMIADNEEFPWAFTFKKLRTGAEYPSGFVQDNVLASYLHLHFAGDSRLANHFIDTCEKYKLKRKEA